MMKWNELDVDMLRGRSQQCLGCERRILAKDWFIHSQECILLEAVVLNSMSFNLNLSMEGMRDDYSS